MNGFEGTKQVTCELRSLHIRSLCGVLKPNAVGTHHFNQQFRFVLVGLLSFTKPSVGPSERSPCSVMRV